MNQEEQKQGPEADEARAMLAAIKAQGVSATRFLSMAGVSSSTWHRILNDETIPNGATMRRLRDAAVKIEQERTK